MCMKRCSASLILREMKSKPQNHLTPARTAGIKKSEVGEDVGKREPSRTGGANAD